MTNIPTFADAMRCEPATVLRLPLLPYSVGHEIILQSEKNILVCPDSDKEYPINTQCAALIRAVLVCSRPYTERDTENGSRWFRKWERTLEPKDFLEGMLAFCDYRANGSTFPKIPSKDAVEAANGKQDFGRQLGGELMPRLLAFLAGKESSFGFATVFDFPLGMALHIFFGYLEMEGRLFIENDNERQAQKEIEEAEAWAKSPEAEKAKQDLMDKLKGGG